MTDSYDDILPGAPLVPTGNRQLDRKRARIKADMEDRIRKSFKVNHMAEAAYSMGYNEGLKRGTEFSLKDGYAAALLAMKEIGKYGSQRSRRLLKAIDEIVVNRLTTEELIDEVFERLGVRINFSDPFDRIMEVES